MKIPKSKGQSRRRSWALRACLFSTLALLISNLSASAADKEISDLTAATTAATSDIVHLQINVAGTWRDRKMTLANLASIVGGTGGSGDVTSFGTNTFTGANSFTLGATINGAALSGLDYGTNQSALISPYGLIFDSGFVSGGIVDWGLLSSATADGDLSIVAADQSSRFSIRDWTYYGNVGPTLTFSRNGDTIKSRYFGYKALSGFNTGFRNYGSLFVNMVYNEATGFNDVDDQSHSTWYHHSCEYEWRDTGTNFIQSEVNWGNSNRRAFNSVNQCGIPIKAIPIGVNPSVETARAHGLPAGTYSVNINDCPAVLSGSVPINGTRSITVAGDTTHFTLNATVATGFTAGTDLDTTGWVRTDNIQGASTYASLNVGGFFSAIALATDVGSNANDPAFLFSQLHGANASTELIISNSPAAGETATSIAASAGLRLRGVGSAPGGSGYTANWTLAIDNAGGGAGAGKNTISFNNDITGGYAPFFITENNLIGIGKPADENAGLGRNWASSPPASALEVDGTLTARVFSGSGSGLSTGSINDTILASAVKPAVAVVATSNLTLSGEQTIDGVTTSGSLVLATAQSTGTNNGPWLSASGAWSRPGWFTNGSATQAPQFSTCFVRLGTTYQGSVWRMTTASVTIGTTAQTWVQTPNNVNSATGTLAVANGGTGVTSKSGTGSVVLNTGPTISGATLTGPVINGAASTGSTSLDFSGNSGTFLTSTGANTIGGDATFNGNLSLTGSGKAVTLSPAAAGTVTIAPGGAASITAGGALTLTSAAGGAITITSSGAGTMNNVAIGGTTPVAGTFTALAGTTSTATPLIIGGSGASSALTVESTSGTGTTDSIAFKTGSQFTRWTVNTSGHLIPGADNTYNIGTSSSAGRVASLFAIKVVVNNSGLFRNGGTNLTQLVDVTENVFTSLQLASLTANTSVTIGGGTALTKAISNTSTTWDPGNLADGASETKSSITLTGAAVGDVVTASLSTIVASTWKVQACVTASDTVAVTITNNTGGAVDLASGTLRINWFKF